jgi:hypothetical protein
MDVIINETKLALPSNLETWGELLDWVETQHLQSGECITRVLFAGEEELNYRGPAVCDRAIVGDGAIQIESGDFDAVVRESLSELEAELNGALESTRQVIRLLESRDDEAAYNELSHLMDAIQIFFAVFSEDLGWVDIADRDLGHDGAMTQVEMAIPQLAAAQENRVGGSVSSVLKYEIIPILETWKTIARRTRARVN